MCPLEDQLIVCQNMLYQFLILGSILKYTKDWEVIITSNVTIMFLVV